jgi:hypothetical protein
MYESGDKRETEKRSGVRPHEEFLELCAVSTSGELSEEEQKRLEDHVATCRVCLQALREFQEAANVGVPLLSSALAPSTSSEPRLGSEQVAEATERTKAGSEAQVEGACSDSNPKEQSRGTIFADRNGHSRTQTDWRYVWMSLAAAVVLVTALGIYSFQFGRQKGQEVVQMIPGAPDRRMEALEEQVSDTGHEREVLKTQLALRDGIIAGLRRQFAEQSAALSEVKVAQASLEQSLQNDQAEKQRVAQERSGLIQKLDAVQASLQKTQTELDSIRLQRSQDQSRSASLEAQIRDLNGQLRDREQLIGKQEELLAHDSDIRDLMGARELYIAEVYDVGRDGTTQKPYGRVFYTKGKSLIFYAYDLDQQPGVKNASTFQAWGRGGPDRQQVLNLGIFYHDSGAKKRWVLKFDDPHMLEQLDAVFVTVEPTGGSHKPSSKPLLFASLRIQANHP